MSLKIIYVANHDSGGADDEGAITHALQELGHRVQRLREQRGMLASRLQANFLLFHKWDDFQTLKNLRMPKAFWYFDLVDYPDPTLTARCRARREWMRKATEVADMGFCTDGDWVARDRAGKLCWLPQGADDRIAGAGGAGAEKTPILFTGITAGGAGRQSFVADLSRRYGSRFVQHQRGLYREELKAAIGSSAIVVAPDSPVSDRYCSNRVFISLGFGAFLLHPVCRSLSFRDREDLVYYRSREELFALIDYYLDRPEERARIAATGLKTTLEKHLYLHRCEELVAKVKERLL